MKKIKKFIIAVLILSAIFNLVACDCVIFGRSCYVYTSPIAETENLIIFERAIFNKQTKDFTICMETEQYCYSNYFATDIVTLPDCYKVISPYSIDTLGYDGKLISTIENNDPDYKIPSIGGFYSSFQRENWDELPLDDNFSAVWNYAKSKSLKKEFPYMIEGEFKENESSIVFSVNVYDKMMWKGSALVNQGVVMGTLNKFDKQTKQITELFSFKKRAVKAFFGSCIYLYNKNSDRLEYFDITSGETTRLFKIDQWQRYYVCEKYVITEDVNTVPFKYFFTDINDYKSAA